MREFRELLLEEMLADPIVRALMAADGVDPEELKMFCARQQDRVETARFDGSHGESLAACRPRQED